MVCEIGSEFWSVPRAGNTENEIFPQWTNWYLSGTSALHAVICDIKKKQSLRTVALPSWCCECMIQPFLDHGINVLFYSVISSGDTGITFDFSDISPCDAVLIMDYFGYRRKYQFPDFDGIIIRDLTHSIFCGEYNDADYYFGSLRKWAGFWTGGFAWRQDGRYMPDIKNGNDSEQYIHLRKIAMEEKQNYIRGHSDSKKYLEIFKSAEDILDQGCLGRAASRDIELSRYLDCSLIKKRRRENAELLLNTVSDIALFPYIEEQDCPMFVPILLSADKRDAIRNLLIKERIYCPIHWPVSRIHQLNNKSDRIYYSELSLICDQRYEKTEIEMESKKVLYILKNFT